MEAVNPAVAQSLRFEENKRRKREGIVILVTALMVAALIFFEVQLPDVTPEYSLGGNVVFFLLININIILLGLLVFLVVRSLIKLMVQHKRRMLGSRLQARLVLAFAALLTRGVRVPERERIVVRAEPADRAFMAIDVLRELLFRFDREGLVPASCCIEGFSESEGAVLHVGVGPHDPEAHAEGMELKAVTLHQARFEREDGGWVAQVVFDV